MNNLTKLSNEDLITQLNKEYHFGNYPDRKLSNNYFKLLNESKKRKLSINHLENDSKNEIILSDMDFIDFSTQRKSIRKFLKDDVTKEDIDVIIKCAMQSPSSCNRQTIRYMVITNSNDKKFISDFRNLSFIYDSPLIIVVLVYKKAYHKDEEYSMYLDTGSSVMNILYSSQCLNYGACWINFGNYEIKKDINLFYDYFKISKDYLPTSAVIIGKPNQDIKKPIRNDFKKNILYYD